MGPPRRTPRRGSSCCLPEGSSTRQPRAEELTRARRLDRSRAIRALEPTHRHCPPRNAHARGPPAARRTGGLAPRRHCREQGCRAAALPVGPGVCCSPHVLEERARPARVSRPPLSKRWLTQNVAAALSEEAGMRCTSCWLASPPEVCAARDTRSGAVREVPHATPSRLLARLVGWLG